MADGLNSGAATTRTRPGKQSLSGAWIVMLLSGLIAAVVFLYVTNSANQRYTVLVANKDIPAGTVVNSTFFTETEITVNDSTLGQLVQMRENESLNGKVAVAFVGRGDLVPKSSFRSPASNDRTRHAMTIPVEKVRAVNGDLHPGDRISIIDGGNTDKPVAENVEILTVNSSTGGGIATTANFSVTVLVDNAQELSIAKAIVNNKLVLTRTTGTNGTTTGASSSTDESSSTGTGAASNNSSNSNSNNTGSGAGTGR